MSESITIPTLDQLEQRIQACRQELAALKRLRRLARTADDARKARFLREYITVAQLAEFGLTLQDVRRQCPHAVEYTALDRSPCWLRDDLASLLEADRRSNA